VERAASLKLKPEIATQKVERLKKGMTKSDEASATQQMRSSNEIGELRANGVLSLLDVGLLFDSQRLRIGNYAGYRNTSV
jgi:hypothetical protein